MQVSIRELKNNLSRYLHILEKEEIIVTSHHKPVAKIIPINVLQNEKTQLLSAIDWIQWNGKKPQGNKNAPKISQHFASDYIIEDRR